MSLSSSAKKISDNIIIATSTLYKPNLKSDRIRMNLAKKLIKNASALDYEVIIVDGGSTMDLLTDFSNLGARVYEQQKKGMGNGRREAMRYAFETGREILIWTEPEKANFISEISKTVKPILEGKSELVVPKRKSLDSYPITQQYSEPLGNLFFKKLTGFWLDIYFGPKIFNNKSVNYFLDYDGEYGDLWDSIQIPVMNAIFDKKRVLSVEVDYTHPREQTEIEEDHLNFYRIRIEQLTNQMNSLESHWKNLMKI